MKIYIQKPMISGTGVAKIWVMEERGRERYSIQFDSQSKMLKQKLLNENVAEEVEPFIELPYGFFDDFVKAVVDFASENNIKTESETLLQGKLSATEKHLEDLRTHFTKVLDKVVGS